MNNKKLIGLVHLRILAPKSLKEPYLEEERIKDKKKIFGTCSTCIQTFNTGECNHSPQERSQVQTLVWEEVNFCVSVLNYEVLQIFECHQYETELPLFTSFIKLLALGKLRHSLSNTSQKELDYINNSMKIPERLKIKKSDIIPDSSKTNFYKKMLCSFLGKLAQTNNKRKIKFVRNKNQLYSLFYSEKIVDLFVYDNVCQVVIKPKVNNILQNRSSNCTLYSYITSYARIYMHKCMLKLWSINANIMAIENDCIYFTLSKSLPNPLIYSRTFGCFKNEVSNVILYYSFGSKSSSLSYIHNGVITHKIRARGFSLKPAVIENILHFSSLGDLMKCYMEHQIVKLKIPQIRNYKHVKTMSVKQKLSDFTLTNEIVSKRIVYCDLTTVPYGYCK